MTADDLFPEARSLSPRAAWMKRHMLICIAEDPALVGVESPETGDQAAPFYCLRSDAEGCMQEQPLDKIGRGDDPEGACAEFARLNGLRLWNEGAAT